jgi:hypothetical protein
LKLSPLFLLCEVDKSFDLKAKKWYDYSEVSARNGYQKYKK